MINLTQNLNQENNPITISSDTIEYYMQKGQQERSDSIARTFTGVKSRINCFFKAFYECRENDYLLKQAMMSK
ncbi:MAG: hypothetical protein ACI88H_001562 [Cocleimonas sp.]|jgi:hypothetical protein